MGFNALDCLRRYQTSVRAKAWQREAGQLKWDRKRDALLVEAVRKHGEGKWQVCRSGGGGGGGAGLCCIRCCVFACVTHVHHHVFPYICIPTCAYTHTNTLIPPPPPPPQAIGGELGCAPSTAMYRWRSKIKPSLHSTIKKGPWHKTEDQQLKLAVEYFGMQWTQVARMVDGRTDAQCRERWCNVLDPSLK